MAISVSGSTINVNGGTHTWSEVVAAGSSSMSTTDNVDFWSGTLNVSGGATLNITDACIRLSGKIRCSGDGTINFGELAVVDGQEVTRKGCLVYVTDSSSGTGFGDFPISYTSSNSSGNRVSHSTSRFVNLYGTSIIFDTSQRRDMAVTSLIDSAVIYSTGNSDANLYTAAEGQCRALRSRLINGRSWELVGAPAEFSDNQLVNVVRSVYNFQSGGIINIRNLVSVGGSFPFRTDEGAIRLVDPVRVSSNDPNILDGAFDSFKAVSQNVKFIDTSGIPISNVEYRLVDAESTEQYNEVSDVFGDVPEAIIDDTRYERITDTNADVISLAPFSRTIKSYGHQPSVDNNYTPEKLGTPDSSATQVLIDDLGVTSSETAAALLVGFTHSDSSISMSSANDIEDMYDSRKKWWRDNNTTAQAPTRVGSFANFDNESIAISSTLTANGKYTGLETTGGITIETGATVDGIIFNGDVTLTGDIYFSDVTINGNLVFNQPSVIVNFNNVTVTGDVTNANGSGTVSILGSGNSITTSTPGSGNGEVFIAPPTLTLTNVVIGSRIHVEHVENNNATVFDGVAVSFNPNLGVGSIPIGDTLKVTILYCDGTTLYDWWEGVAVMTNEGATLIVNQQEVTAYAALGVDGSTVTEFTLDNSNIEVDVSDPDGLTTKRRLVAWFYYAVAQTPSAIKNFWKAGDLLDEATFVFRSSVVDVTLDNPGTVQVRLTDDDFLLYRDDNAPVVKFPSSGGQGITFSSGKIFIAETGVSGLTSQESSALLGISPNLTTINEGVKKASLLVPHTDDL